MKKTSPQKWACFFFEWSDNVPDCSPQDCSYEQDTGTGVLECCFPPCPSLDPSDCLPPYDKKDDRGSKEEVGVGLPCPTDVAA